MVGRKVIDGDIRQAGGTDSATGQRQDEKEEKEEKEEEKAREGEKRCGRTGR